MTRPGSLRAVAAWVLVALIGVAVAAWGPFGAAAQEQAQQGEDAAEMIRQGEQLFGLTCGVCHGVDASGGVTAGGLEAPPLDPELNERSTIAYNRMVMATGRMPPAGDPRDNRIREVTVDEQEREAILAYLADAFGIEGDVPEPGHGDVARGLEIYAENCAACHGATGAGGVAGGGAWTPRVNDVGAQTLADAIRTGPFQMPRFDEEQISDEGMADIAAFMEEVEEEGGTLLFPGELNPVFASGFGAGLAAVIVMVLVLIAGKPTMFPDPQKDAEDAPMHEPEEREA